MKGVYSTINQSEERIGEPEEDRLFENTHSEEKKKKKRKGSGSLDHCLLSCCLKARLEQDEAFTILKD